MKKVVILLSFLFFLGGCSDSSKEIERGMALRDQLLRASSCSFETAVTADYGDKVYVFGMICQGDSAGDVTFSVTTPDTIAGITGTISEEGGRLTFDDAALQFDLMADEQLSPVSAPWILLKTLRSGYLTSACMEEDLLRLTIDDSYEEDALNLDIWVNSENMPVRAEILYDGRRILTLDVKAFQIM